MSRVTPKLNNGDARGWGVDLTKAQVDHISDACGVHVAPVAKWIGRALSSYHLNALASATATPVRVAEKRLDRLLALATELHSLNEERFSLHEPDGMLRHELRCLLEEHGGDAGRKADRVLGDYIVALEKVRRVIRNEPQVHPSAGLARNLEKIWTGRLKQERTISSASGGSKFVCFVWAATDALPSHWPWRPEGRRDFQSLEAFATALRRELDR